MRITTPIPVPCRGDASPRNAGSFSPNRLPSAIAAAALFVAGALLPAAASGQQLPKGTAARIDSIFADYNKPDAPGCAVGIYKDGKIIYAKGYGSADLEHDVAITPQTRFDIGSTSKQFTAACLVLLELDGELSLEDDVRKYIPELPDYGKTITIRQMLNHTSGLRDYLGLMLMGGTDIDDHTTMNDALRVVTRQKGLDFEPGTAYEYSNTGYFLASVIVERVTGKSLRQFAAQRIFKPLGMERTTYIDDHTTVLPGRAIGYSPDVWGFFHRDVSYWEQNGDGGVFTSVEDLLRWDENFYRPNPEAGGEQLVQGLLRQGTLDDGTRIDYALGLFFDTLRGLETVQHGGSWSGYRAELMRVPGEHVSVAVLANRSDINPSKLARGTVEILLEDRFPEPDRSATSPQAGTEQETVKIDPTTFDAYAGDYALEVKPDFVLTMWREGDRYYSQATGQGPVEIFPSSDSTFFLKVVPASLTFHRDADGTVREMTLHQGGNLRARRVEKSTVTVEQLNAYAGEYYSPELETAYTIAVEEGKLTARHERFDPITLTPAGTDEFGGDQWSLQSVRFERDKTGRVVAFLVSAGRVTELRFERRK